LRQKTANTPLLPTALVVEAVDNAEGPGVVEAAVTTADGEDDTAPAETRLIFLP
jgi:hypothetical protein